MALDLQRVQKNIRKLRKLLNKSSRLRSPERVHDLRTRTRRIEAMFPAAGLVSRRDEKQLLRQLRPIRKRAGKVRDMDVLTSHVLELDVEGENECEVRLLEYLGAERYRHGRKLRKRVRANRKQLTSRLKHASRQIEAVMRTAKEATAGDRRPQIRAAASALELASELARPKTLSRNSLHPYRLKIKELRYILKNTEGGADQPFLKALSECKDAIGEWHDWDELLGTAVDLLDHGGRCNLIEQMKAVTRKKFDMALLLTNAMRRQFVYVRTPRKNRPHRKDAGKMQLGLKTAGAIAR